MSAPHALLPRIAATTIRHGVPLIVDEAHGAHLSQHPSFPPSALSQGADIVVQSTHKVGRLLHVAALTNALPLILRFWVEKDSSL